MEIKNSDDTKKGQFYIDQDGRLLAIMTYVYAGPKLIIIDHTEVSPELKGRGVGKMLVEHAVLFAREKDLKIRPFCHFAKSVLKKTPDYQDVLSL